MLDLCYFLSQPHNNNTNNTDHESLCVVLHSGGPSRGELPTPYHRYTILPYHRYTILTYTTPENQ